MMKKINFTKKVITFLHSRRNFYGKQMMHPTREWLLGLSFFAIVVIAGGIINAHIFLTYLNVKTDEGIFKEEIETYNKALAKTALNIYEERKTNYLALQDSGMAEIIVVEVQATSSTSTTTTSDAIDVQEVTESENVISESEEVSE